VVFNLFWFTAPYKTEKNLAAPLPGLNANVGHPEWLKNLKGIVNSIFGGTPDTSSRHPYVPRHPGWEPLL